MLVFYLFAALLLLQSLISLRGGFKYLAFVRRRVHEDAPPFTPFASVIAPCRGLDQGLEENVRALSVQDYPAYEIIFVTDDAADASLEVIESVLREAITRRAVSMRVVIAGAATDSGQKVHNLRAAASEVDERSEVLVFVDTDARAHEGWLRHLVAPLRDERVGAATGYRWFIPSSGLAARLRAVWNASIASALGANSARNFCWGGSTAIRRETFERVDMLSRWRGTLSDDFALTRALQSERLLIEFVPQCLMPSFEDCVWRELLEFTTRQMKITRVYAPHLWKIVLCSNLIFSLVFFGGLALVIVRAWLNQSYAPALALLAAVYALGALKAYLRLRAVRLALKSYPGVSNVASLSHLVLWPLTSLLYLYNAVAAAFSRRIVWRGIAYELRSPEETIILNASG